MAGFGRAPDEIAVCPASSRWSAAPRRGAGEARQLRASSTRQRAVDAVLAARPDVSRLPAGCAGTGHAAAATARHGFARTMLAKALRERMTWRDLFNLAGAARGHWVVCGTPEEVADTLQEWFESAAADGFNILPTWFPGGPRRLRRPGRARAAAARPVPHRIRGHDAARPPRLGPAAQPAV